MRFISLVWVTPTRVLKITNHARVPSEVGAKARGLLNLPSAWVPTFLVLSPEFYAQYVSAGLDRRPGLLKTWTPLLERAIETVGLADAGHLSLRSNAVHETLSERGRFRSVDCSRAKWISQLAEFYERAAEYGSSVRMGVIVQRQITPILVSGHLSNERRVAREYRDAVVEFTETSSGDMTSEPLTFRRWRKAAPASTDALACPQQADLLTVLREPLALAAADRVRVHYEWLWDGQFIHVVQADLAADPVGGISPASVFGERQEHREVPSLRVFRLARRTDEGRSSKLHNHYLYEDNGYTQPEFYLMENAEVLEKLLKGIVDERLVLDLEALTYRPLVIRTSCSTEGRALLPRSDLLYNSASACDWLTGPFAAESRGKGLDPKALSLLAHHFIPAVAAAFSTGSPSGREVYVEALWGIPEGLYYYPCDAFYVDTHVQEPADLKPETRVEFSSRKEIRYKEEFVSPDSGGRFVLHRTARPWDWKSTIADDSLLADIAFFTRKLAFIEGKRITVMWFLGCEADTGLPKALPWYHDDEADEWAGPDLRYRRNARDERLDIRTLGDLTLLETKALARYKPASGCLVVTLNPAEDQVIRDQRFAERVGQAAAALNAVVELQGGFLSHVYYVLKRSGARIVARSRPRLVGAPAGLRKLVRDKIPEVVVSHGERARISRLPSDQRRTALKIKLVEEAYEARDASSEQLIYELADVLDVVAALIEVTGISRRQLSRVRQRKGKERGGFGEGVVLIETSAGSDSPTDRDEPSPDLLPPGSAPSAQIIEAGQPPPLEEARQGPFDSRRGLDFLEFVQTWRVSLTQPEWVLSSPRGLLMRGDDQRRAIEWTLECKREGAHAKLRLKILLGTRQLSLPLDPGDEREMENE